MGTGAENYASRDEVKDVERELNKTKESVSKEINSLNLAIRDLTHAIELSNQNNEKNAIDYDQLGRAISGSVSAALNNLNIDGKLSDLDKKIESSKVSDEQPDKLSGRNAFVAGLTGKSGVGVMMVCTSIVVLVIALLIAQPRLVLSAVKFMTTGTL